MAYLELLDESLMRTFLAMCNQFSKFFPDLSHLCNPLRERLKKEVIYEFGPVEKKHFNLIKEAMSAKMNLVSYSQRGSLAFTTTAVTQVLPTC